MSPWLLGVGGGESWGRGPAAGELYMDAKVALHGGIGHALFLEGARHGPAMVSAQCFEMWDLLGPVLQEVVSVAASRGRSFACFVGGADSSQDTPKFGREVDFDWQETEWFSAMLWLGGQCPMVVFS